MAWAVLGILLFLLFFNVRLSLFTLVLVYMVWYAYVN